MNYEQFIDAMLVLHLQMQKFKDKSQKVELDPFKGKEIELRDSLARALSDL